MKITFTLLLVFLLSLNSNSQNITGDWYGELSGNSSLLILNLDKEKSSYTGTFSFFQSWHNYLNAPFDKISYLNDSLKFEFTLGKALNYQYKGKFNANNGSIAGKMKVIHLASKQNWSVQLNFKRETIKLKERRTGSGLNEHKVFTRTDSLRGAITPEREWWDLKYYHLSLKVNIPEKSIAGSNIIRYKVLKEKQLMQIDLQQPLKILEVVQNEESLEFKRDSNVYYINLKKKQLQGDINELIIRYEGKPHVAETPPWDGGFTWAKDSVGNPFIATSCQGIGASIWWPNKDHMYDEVDSMLISVNVPSDLVGVSNGKLENVEKLNDGTNTYHWFVSNPINNYGVNVNIADYAHFSEIFKGEKGNLNCNYYVLKENLDKARAQFTQVGKMLKAFEYWFGPYPFYEDGYKLVEVPYLGMEHQSSVTYGNHYQNGIDGMDISGTGWGDKFDYIIIHESGHEWFANNITYKDIADMWVHEGFTTYSEALYVEYYYGKKAGAEYITGTRRNIMNDEPIIGLYDVNKEGSGDMYPKGANLLHTLRQIVDNDDKWRGILRGLNKDFYHATVTTGEIERYIADKAGMDLNKIFDQYLRSTMVPTFEYYFKDDRLTYRWTNCIEGFDMPLKVYLNGTKKWINPKTIWTDDYLDVGNKQLRVDPNFYVSYFKSFVETH